MFGAAGITPSRSCLAEDHHEDDQHRSRDAVELRSRIQWRGNRVETIGHLPDTGLVDLPDRGVFELWDEVPVDLALVRADGGDCTFPATAVRLRADERHPAFRVLGEADGPCFLCLRCGTASSGDHRGRLPLLTGNRRVNTGEPRAGIGLRQERQRLVVLRPGGVHLAVGCGVASLPPARGELTKAPPALTPDCCWFPGLRRAHRVLRWSRADSREPSCHCVPLEVMPSQKWLSIRVFSRATRRPMARCGTRSVARRDPFWSADHPALFWKVRACHPRAIPNDY